MTNPAKQLCRPVAAIFPVLLLAAAVLSSCSDGQASFPVQTLDLVEQTSRETLGRLEPVLVRFEQPVALPAALAEAVSFSPRQKGIWRLKDDRTIEFIPSVPYKSGGAFALRVDSGLLAGKKAGLEGFTVNFNVRPSSYAVIPDGLYANAGDDGLFSFSGVLSTDIPVTSAVARSMVTARLGAKKGGTETGIEWLTDETAAEHRFRINGISRTGEDRFLTLAWKGGPVGSDHSGERTWLVPRKTDFSVLEIAADDPSCILVRFSDRIDPTQDIRGLVRTGTSVAMRYNLDGNILRLYNTDGWQADTDITVLGGIRSLSGKILKQETAARISASWEIPDVRFADDGVILPTSSGVTVAVETRNLRGLIVEAFEINGDNILQFLQVNELDGSYELRRVGEPVWSNSFDFNWDETSMKNRYVARGLDLSGLVKKSPGSMIQLRVTFRQRHVMYECTADHPDFSHIPMPTDEIPVDRIVEDSYWNFFEEMDWKTRESFWNYRDDPCHPAFYIFDFNSSIVKRKNVLVSDLGIMNKLDTGGTYHVAVADIRTALPVSGATVRLYSFARKELITGKTDARGFINLKPAGEPYFITAEKDGRTSYLRIESGTALSVSHFEVDGERSAKGIKGFIYGERGVWRPGDDMHLVFVLQDLKKQLPDGFPVSFELEDPQGRIAKSAVYSEAVDGFYRIDTKTDAADPTGSWTARVKAGGQTWTRALRIESVVPNRLAISLKTAKPYLSASGNEFTLGGAWLHGAKAPNLKADVSAIFYPGTTAFDGYSDYTFVNPERNVESDRKTVWEGNLDGNSEAKFTLDFDAGDALPGKLKAQLVTRLFEPSGMFSTEQAGYDFSPYERYVGLRLPKGDATRGMLLTDTKHRADIALLDLNGKPAGGTVPVSVSLYKLEWRWWWEKDALTDATYVSGRSTDLIANGTVTVRNGKGSWDFEIEYPEWGRYLLLAEDENGGHSAARVLYVDWPGWAGRGTEAGSGSAAMLSLQGDKKLYRPGETAAVSFGSGTEGRALVTVEKDGAILAQDWLDTAAGTTVYKLPVTGEMAPNAYVHVTLLQKHMQSANSLPIRLYGVIPLMVEDPQTRLSPVIVAPAQYEPGKTATLSVSEAAGRPMTYTVAVVDEGLLGLTRFTANDPWKEFYKKEASSLASWDLYRYVMSAFGGKLETLLSIGGSEDGINANNKKAERFKPVVRFFGPYELKAKGKNETSFEMSQYVGAVRVMVVAGKAGAYGTAERTVPVRSDLMVLPTLPRTLGVNETVEVPVTLFNGKETAQTVPVTLSGGGVLKTVLSQNVTVPPMADKTVTFRISTDIAGMATVRVQAGAVESVTEIDVLSRGSPLVTGKKFTVAPGAVYRDFMPSPGEKGTRKLSVELATMPVLDLDMRLKYLIEYPHGCIEQITSGAFPQLFVPDLIDTVSDETARIKKNIMSVIERFPRYQTASGGFAYWPGNGDESPWGTSYAGHFLIEAKKAGYEVPDSLFTPWLSYQKDEARTWQPDEKQNDLTVQAYRLYTLALAGAPDLGGMNRLASYGDITESAGWLLAGAYALAGHRDTAVSMTAKLDTNPPPYRETGDTWGSDRRDRALALNTLNIMADTRRSADLVPFLAEQFASGRWFSTQETAWMLLALAPHYRGQDRTPAAWAIEWDKGSVEGEIRRSAIVRNLEAFDSPTQTLVVRNTGTKTLYGKATTRGTIAAGKETKVETGLGLTVQYFDQNDTGIRAASLAPGDSFSIRVTVSNLTRKAVDNVALSLPVPTAWEFANERIGAAEETEFTTGYDYRDIKDTEISTYFGMKPDEDKTFVFHATVAYNGNYYVPAVRAEAMYDADYQAVLPGQFIRRIAGIPAP